MIHNKKHNICNKTSFEVTCMSHVLYFELIQSDFKIPLSGPQNLIVLYQSQICIKCSYFSEFLKNSIIIMPPLFL